MDPNFNFSTYKVTETDRIVNYTVGTLLFFCFLISTILNPVIWYHHRSEDKKKLTTFLFSNLAVFDFLTNLIAPLGYSWFLMSPKHFSEHDFEFFPFNFIGCTLGCMSQCVATLLAVSRTLKIINPFRSVKKQVLKYYLLCYSLFMMVNNVSIPLIHIFILKKSQIDIFNLDPLTLIAFVLLSICYWLNIIHCFIGIVFSTILVVYVYKQGVSQSDYNMRKRAGVTIFLMNVAYIITITCMFLNVFQRHIFKQFVNFTAISFVFAPILTSGLNPIILFTRVRKIRQTFYSLIRSCFAIKMRFGRVTPVVFDNVQLSYVQNTVAGSSVTVIETAQ